MEQHVNIKRVDLFKKLAGVFDKEGYSSRELDSWERDIGMWGYLSEDFRTPLRQKWVKLEGITKTPESVAQELYDLASLSNGFANAAAHMTGYIVREVLQAGEKVGVPPERSLDDLVAACGAQLYEMYSTLLDVCRCDDCTAVLDFDAR